MSDGASRYTGYVDAEPDGSREAVGRRPEGMVTRFAASQVFFQDSAQIWEVSGTTPAPPQAQGAPPPPKVFGCWRVADDSFVRMYRSTLPSQKIRDFEAEVLYGGEHANIALCVGKGTVDPGFVDVVSWDFGTGVMLMSSGQQGLPGEKLITVHCPRGTRRKMPRH
ncbi:hypothetical protein C8R44DRAFT_752778 [Mycena epipterygia]|nr:hypothetical protein C8R44DRAFT_752778 [Mycena epipterygia]